MAEKPTYKELEKRIKQLEREVLEYVRKEKEFDEERKFLEHHLIKQNISLMEINEELKREIRKRKRADEEELDQISHRLRGRIRELSCLYDISRLGGSIDFSLDAILQAVIDLIPSAFQYPEIACARIIFDRYEFTTKNFKDTRWKFSREITANNDRIGTLEVCYLEEKQALDDGPFSKEAKNFIGAIAEGIAKIVEREWAEAEIRKQRERVEKLINNTRKNSL